jgi:hypothetical protein
VVIGGFMGFLIGEKYRLEIKWDKVLRPISGQMLFENAKFTGPVLKIADKIKSNDSINLDFCSQYTIITKGVYTGKFSWDEAVYNKDGNVELENARLEYDPSIKGIPNLEDKDYLVIDTRNHENEKHYFNVFYNTYVINKNNELYDFRSK